MGMADRRGTCLVLGGAECVFRDVEAALDLGEFQGIGGANHIGIYWEGTFDFWVSLHGDKLLKPWRETRRRAGLPDHLSLHTHPTTWHRFPGQTKPGSSGLYALKVALCDLGFDRAVLCGIPLEIEAAHFDTPGPWRPASHYQHGWVQALPHIRARARSMSGWTRQLLGAPTPDWIAGD